MIRNPYLSSLSGELQSAYFTIVNAASSGISTVSCHIPPECTDEDFERLSLAISFGNPGLILGKRFQTNGREVILEFLYPEDNSQRQESLFREVERISAIINRDCHTDIEKVERIATYLCRRVEGEHNPTRSNGTAYGALIERKARCEGYSKAATLICDRVGLNCEIVSGFAESGGQRIQHAWNIIDINGVPYHFDFAWSDSASRNKIPCMVYLFLSDASISLDHTEDAGIAFSICPSDELYFTKRHHGEIHYGYEVEGADVLESKNDFYSVFHFLYPINDEDIEAFISTVVRPHSKGHRYTYHYDSKRSVLQMYYLHEE